jgi:hypothetical protein
MRNLIITKVISKRQVASHLPEGHHQQQQQ